MRTALVAAAIAAVLCTGFAVVVHWQAAADGAGLSAQATVTASSTSPGSSARNVVDTGSASMPGADWQSDQEARGAWIELDWPGPQSLCEITIVRNNAGDPGVTAGFLSFGDGSFLDVRLAAGSRMTRMPFSCRSSERVRFTATDVDGNSRNVTISEIVVRSTWSGTAIAQAAGQGGNAAPSATVTQSGPGSDARAVVDGSGGAGAAGAGAAWTVARPVGAWVQLTWSNPQELTSVELVGDARQGATIGGGTLTFDDGSTLPVGAVLADPDRPTILGFLPRVTTAIRFTIDRAAGTGAVALAELRAYQHGSTPVRTISPASTPPPAAATACPATGAGSTPVLVVQCPVNGSSVTGDTEMRVSVAPGYTSVSATLWPGDMTAPVSRAVTASPVDGSALLELGTSEVSGGPLTVDLVATGAGEPDQTVHFQLYRRGGAPADIASGPPAAGRTLVYADEFDRPVTVSRDGTDADYAAGKPTNTGAEDFGDAPFGDPAQGVNTVGVVDNRTLSIDVQPGPPGATTRMVGGMLASARPGGSGFAAQYGYFEARILAPASPGTWPAFWLLPDDNLVARTPVVAEIDTLESYGHDPASACHSTHSYADGKDTSNVRCGRAFSSDRQALAWHTYGVSVTPAGLAYYTDGIQVATAPQIPGGDAPMFFMLDLALGGGWPVDLRGVQDRASMYVDYVRVYV